MITCSFALGDSPTITPAQVVCEATGPSSVDEDFARRHHLPLTALPEPRILEVIDGRLIASGDVANLTTVTMTTQGHTDLLPLFVTKLGHCLIVPGIPWLCHNGATTRFARGE